MVAASEALACPILRPVNAMSALGPLAPRCAGVFSSPPGLPIARGGGGGGGAAPRHRRRHPVAAIPHRRARRHCFGARPQRDSLAYAEEGVLAYLSGHSAVLYTTESRAQRFVGGGAEAAAITALALCPARRLLALAERGAERAPITVFDQQTLKRRKVLTCSVEGAPKVCGRGRLAFG